jgi:hypothetical protein
MKKILIMAIAAIAAITACTENIDETSVLQMGKPSTNSVRVITDPEITITLQQYGGDEIRVTYTNGDYEDVERDRDGTFHLIESDDTIKSIKLETGSPILIGRAGNVDLTFKVQDTLFVFRDPVAGKIPIGSYAEFQLINTDSHTLSYDYFQEDHIDLLNEEWHPVTIFTGTFDGGGYSLSNLSINTPGKGNDAKGLFGVIISGDIQNIAIVSGSVIAANIVGGICGQIAAGSITACYNKASITGVSSVGGICGINDMGTDLTASYNTGTVTGNDAGIGGVCGHNYGDVTACYNTGLIFGGTAGYWIGGVCGYGDPVDGTVTACYWMYDPNDDARTGIGYPASDTNAAPFSSTEWPNDRMPGWATGSGNRWKSLGGWNSGNPVFPSLWFE